MEMKKWVNKVKKTIKEGEAEVGGRKSIDLAIVSDNHRAGFGPDTTSYTELFAELIRYHHRSPRTSFRSIS